MALFSELKEANPKLFYDAVCRGFITYSEAGALTPGNVVTNTLVEGILGGPHAQENSGYNPLTTDIIGAGTGYPKPWRSAGHKLQDASYGSTIGPFARIVPSSISDPSFPGQCCEPLNDLPVNNPCQGGIFGRIGIGDGNHLGFRAQDWHGQAEGTYNTAYWQNQGANWDTWKDWWDNCTKTTITCIWEDIPGNPEIQVEVANDYIEIGDDDYFPGLDGKVYLDASLDLLVAMVALAVFVRW
jgi:hypothetical protein